MNDDHDRELMKLIASGALSGGVIGGVGSLVGGAKGFGPVGKAAAVGAGLSGGLAGLSGSIGLKAFGSPSEEDGSGYTKRLGAGGAAAGGIAGAATGAMMGIPRLRNFLASKLGGGLLSKGVAALKGGVPAAATLGVGGAAVGAYQGADEGMQMDFIRNLSRKDQEDLLRRQIKGMMV